MSETQTVPQGELAGLMARFNRMTIKEGLRILFVVGGVWASFWAWGGDFITARADDILVEALKRKGMGPADIKLIQDRLISLGLDLDRSQVSLKHVNEELDRMQGRLDGIESNQRQTNEMLRALIPLMKADLGNK